MFHFPTFPPHALCVQARVTPHDWCGVPPFGHPRINARLAAPRGLSQPPTSFIGSWCPGIHRVPLTTWPHNYNKPHTHPGRHQHTRALPPTGVARACNQRRCSRPLCSSQRPTGHHPDPPPPNPTPAAQRVRRRRRVVRGPGRPRPRQPTPTGAHVVPDARGVRSLRTQQRAYDRTSPPPPRSPRTPEGTRRTGSGSAATGRTGQRSTLEHCPEHPRPPTGGEPSRSEHSSGPPARELAASAP